MPQEMFSERLELLLPIAVARSAKDVLAQLGIRANASTTSSSQGNVGLTLLGATLPRVVSMISSRVSAIALSGLNRWLPSSGMFERRSAGFVEIEIDFCLKIFKN